MKPSPLGAEPSRYAPRIQILAGAWLVFDPKGDGFIRRSQVTNVLDSRFLTRRISHEKSRGISTIR